MSMCSIREWGGIHVGLCFQSLPRTRAVQAGNTKVRYRTKSKGGSDNHEVKPSAIYSS